MSRSPHNKWYFATLIFLTFLFYWFTWVAYSNYPSRYIFCSNGSGINCTSGSDMHIWKYYNIGTYSYLVINYYSSQDVTASF